MLGRSKEIANATMWTTELYAVQPSSVNRGRSMKSIANVYFRPEADGFASLSHFNDTIVLRLQLPAGHYAVFGKVTLSAIDSPQNATVRLTAQDGAEVIDQTSVRVGHFE